MKTIHRTYKFRLKPNSEQRTLLAKHFGCARFVYNHFLAERQEEYKNTGKSSNYYTQQARLTVTSMRLRIYFGGASPNCGAGVRPYLIRRPALAHKNPTCFSRGSMSIESEKSCLYAACYYGGVWLATGGKNALRDVGSIPLYPDRDAEELWSRHGDCVDWYSDWPECGDHSDLGDKIEWLVRSGWRNVGE